MNMHRFKLFTVTFTILWTAEIGVAVTSRMPLTFGLVLSLGGISAAAAVLLAALGPEEGGPHAS